MIKNIVLISLIFSPLNAYASLGDLINQWNKNFSKPKEEVNLAKTFISDEQVLKNSTKENAILFFFRSDCGYCHRYAPILKQFAATYGYSVLSFSLDGRGLPEYPNPRMNTQLTQRLKVVGVPATYIINPRENKITAVSFGLKDYDALSKNMLDALRNDKE